MTITNNNGEVLLDNSYSTNEINTGKKWVDGSVIYRKSYEGSGYFYTDENAVATIQNLDKLIRLDGEIRSGGFYDTQGQFFHRIGEEIYLYNNQFDANTDYHLTIEYTKISI